MKYCSCLPISERCIFLGHDYSCNYQYHKYTFDVYNKTNCLKIGWNLNKLGLSKKYMCHYQHNVMGERAACGKMAAMCGHSTPLTSNADEASSVLYVNLWSHPRKHTWEKALLTWTFFNMLAWYSDDGTQILRSHTTVHGCRRLVQCRRRYLTEFLNSFTRDSVRRLRFVSSSTAASSPLLKVYH